MTSLLRKVKSRLFLRSRRPALHQLDGQYSSHARSRGTDFDDLREYAHGDDVRDIDWKATARSTTVLLRRYHPERRHVVTFVVNTGRSMAAVTQQRELKADVAMAAIGSLAYLATKHGDDVALMYNGATSVERIKPGRTDAHLERVLRAVQDNSSLTAPASDFAALVTTAASSLRHRGIVVCVSDEAPVPSATAATLRVLGARHDLLWIRIGDATFGERTDARNGVVDIDSGWSVPEFVLAEPRLERATAEARKAERDRANMLLASLGVASVDVQGDSEVLPGLVELLGAHGARRG